MNIPQTLYKSLSAWKSETEKDSSIPKKIPTKFEKRIQHIPMDCWGLFRTEDIVDSYLGTGGVATCLGLITWTSRHVLVMHISVEDKALSEEDFCDVMRDILSDLYGTVQENSADILGGWALTADGASGTGGKMLAAVLSLSDKIREAKSNNGTLYCTADSVLYVGPDYGHLSIIDKAEKFGVMTSVKNGTMEWKSVF